MIHSNGDERLFERLARFTVKNPPEPLEKRYTQEVMAKIRASSQPATAWFHLPVIRTGLALGTVAAGLCILFLSSQPHRHPAPDQEALLEETALYDDAAPSAEDLLEQLKQLDEAALSIS